VASSLLVATANVLRTLDGPAAGAALDGVLEHDPDLVGLQEWGPARYGLLRRRGRVRLLPGPPTRDTPAPEEGTGYSWLAPLTGGCAVGARVDRFELLGAGLRLLSGPGRADPGSRDLPVRPPRFAAVATYRDRQGGAHVTFVNYHLMPAVQARGRYRADRPLLVGAHRQEARTLNRIVKERLARGHVVVAVGDSNFDGFRLDGLTSAWAGREDEPGTFGHRRIDDVHGPGPAESVSLLRNASDHRALLARIPLG
jgi:hypothetical protein